ncbi:MAG TPA: CPBP family intramembrane glutamic endopeptidase [Anaerolineales bacterium]|nr:CPBP family intramembrane glutamic endopeptidase [Anaerolineales bacterium]
MRLVVGIIFVMVPVVIIQLLITSLPASKLWQNVLLALFTPPTAIGAYFAFVHFIERRRPTELATQNAPRELLLGALIGALLFGAVMAGLTLFGSLTIGGTNPWSVLLIPFIGAVTSGVFEEILFRGVLYRILEEGLGSWLALLLSGVVFGGLHLLNPNSTLMGAAAVFLTAGILLGACFALTRRLWLPMGLHFAWNLAQSGIFGLAVSGNAARAGLLESSLSGPAWLTGGEFGPEASMVTVVLGLLLGALVLRQVVRGGQIIDAPWRRKRG